MNSGAPHFLVPRPSIAAPKSSSSSTSGTWSSGVCRVAARYQHGHGGAVGAVHVGKRVGLGARLKKRARDLDRVAGRLLPVRLDAVGGHVVEQRRAVHRRIETADAAGSGADQRAIAAERVVERREVTIDHGFDSGFEFEDAALLRDGIDVGGKRGPVKEVVAAGDREAGIVERKDGVADFRSGYEFWTPFDLVVEKARVLAVEQIDGRGIGGAVRGKQALGLLLVCDKR